MPEKDLEFQILQRGKSFFQQIQHQKPLLFNKSQWTGKMIDWAMHNQFFKVNLFRFIDVFPSITSGKSLSRHIREYFLEDTENLPAFMRWLTRFAICTGPLGSKMLNSFISFSIKSMAKQFIVGETTDQAIQSIRSLRQQGFAFVLDILGEAAVNEDEAVFYQQAYLTVLDAIKNHQSTWIPLPSNNIPFSKPIDLVQEFDWTYYPKSQIAVKISALYSQINPIDPENSITKVLDRLKPIYQKVIDMQGSLYLDMETYRLKNITIEVFKRLRSDPDLSSYPHLGLALQTYLKDTPDDLNSLLEWSRHHGLPIEVRLVKGAYWDYETILALENNWPSPVYSHKPESDIAFESLARKVLENHDIAYLASGSHNIRTIAAVMEIAKNLNVPQHRYEFQVLYGMAEPVRQALLQSAGRIRLYCPFGNMISGMAYLVRRLLENTANESFLRQSFAENIDIETLLQDPKITLTRFRDHQQ